MKGPVDDTDFDIDLEAPFIPILVDDSSIRSQYNSIMNEDITFRFKAKSNDGVVYWVKHNLNFRKAMLIPLFNEAMNSAIDTDKKRILGNILHYLF